MEKIYSKVKPQVLLHVIHKEKDFSKRNNLSKEEEFLQASAIHFDEKRKIAPHKHAPQERKSFVTHESLVIVNGLIEASYYDLDDSLLKKEILKPGDCTITFGGGHSFNILEENTKVYEFKNGPYLGKEKDFVLIEDDKE